VPSDGGVRAVIDTNVLLSGLLWRGPPHALIEHARAGMLTVVSSPALLAELAEVIARVKFQTILARSNTNPERMLAELQQLAEIVDPPPLTAPVSRDRDDDAVLALAVACQADLIVSGDADLLTLGAHAGIPIVDAANALVRIGGQTAAERRGKCFSVKDGMMLTVVEDEAERCRPLKCFGKGARVAYAAEPWFGNTEKLVLLRSILQEKKSQMTTASREKR
jgi:uncharacterized protein